MAIHTEIKHQTINISKPTFHFLVFLHSFCSKDESLKGNESLLEEKNLKLVEQLNEKDKKITELKQNIEQLNVQMDDFNMEKEQFVFISSISKELVQAHTTENKEKLSQLLSEDVVLVEKENNLYARILNSDNFEWLLFNNEAKIQFVDSVIQGYMTMMAKQIHLIFL